MFATLTLPNEVLQKTFLGSAHIVVARLHWFERYGCPLFVQWPHHVDQSIGFEESITCELQQQDRHKWRVCMINARIKEHALGSPTSSLGATNGLARYQMDMVWHLQTLIGHHHGTIFYMGGTIKYRCFAFGLRWVNTWARHTQKGSMEICLLFCNVSLGMLDPQALWSYKCRGRPTCPDLMVPSRYPPYQAMFRQLCHIAKQFQCCLHTILHRGFITNP